MRLLPRPAPSSTPSTASRIPGRAPAWQRRYRRHRRALAAVLAGVVVWGVVTTVRPPAPPTAPVLVAQRDLVPGTVVRADDVQSLPRPVESVAGDVLSDPDTAVGRTVSFPVRPGEAVTARHLVGVELLEALGPGLVATPVTLADPGAAALVSRGDVVDVLAAASGASTGTADGRGGRVPRPRAHRPHAGRRALRRGCWGRAGRPRASAPRRRWCSPPPPSRRWP